MTEEFIKRNAHKHEHGEKLEKELMQRMEESKMFRKSVDLAMIFLILAFAAYVVV
jgi:flagellar biogenesis protein FliO